VHLRQEILDAVWPETFITEEVLTNAIWELRQALGGDARKPRYIRTVPRRGYGLVAPVAALTAPGGAAPVRRRWRRRAIVAGILVVLAVASLVVLRAELGHGEKALWPSSIAVLPLKSVSRTPAHTEFAAALTDNLTTQLATSRDYEVPSRTSVNALLERGISADRIPRELGTDAFIEGTLDFSDSGRARLTIQLIDRAHDRHLRAYELEDDIRDRLGAERRLARRVALEPSRGRRDTGDAPTAVATPAAEATPADVPECRLHPALVAPYPQTSDCITLLDREAGLRLRRADQAGEFRRVRRVAREGPVG